MDYPTKQGGLLVTKVKPNGPAYHAGIKGGNQSILINDRIVKIGGDIIVTADNKTFSNVKDFERYYKHKSIGDNMTLKILRDGESKLVNLTVGQHPSQIYESVSKFRDPNHLQFSNYYDINLPIKIEYPSSWNTSKNEFGDTEFTSNYANADEQVIEYENIRYTREIQFESTGSIHLNSTTIVSPNSTHLGYTSARSDIYKLDVTEPVDAR